MWRTRKGATFLGLLALCAIGCGPKFSSEQADAGADAGGDDALSKDGLVYWFAADVGVNESSGRVSRWDDQSGNHFDAAQVTSSHRPKLDRLPGGGDHPTLQFDGEDDSLTLPPLAATFENGLSLFSVARNHGGDTCSAIFEASNGAEIDDISFDADHGRLQYEVFDMSLEGENGAFSEDEPRLVGAVQEADGGVTLWVNGVISGSGNFLLPVPTTRAQSSIGRSLYSNCPTWNGEISEFILYSRALGDDERHKVQSYLVNKWGCCGT